MTHPPTVTVIDPVWRRRARGRHRHAVALVAVAALLVGCAGDDVTAEEPGTGAELVHEQVLAAAVEEVWVVDAPLEEVLEFYAAVPGLEQLPGSAMTSDDGGGYLELEVFSLVREGVTDPAAYEAAVADAPFGPLLRLAVVTPASQVLAWFGGEAGRDAARPGSTVIVFGVLTG